MQNYGSPFNHIIILPNFVLVKKTIDRATGLWNRRIPWRGGGGWDNYFPIDIIICTIPKRVHAQLNMVGGHIYLLSL